MASFATLRGHRCPSVKSAIVFSLSRFRPTPGLPPSVQNSSGQKSPPAAKTSPVSNTDRSQGAPQVARPIPAPPAVHLRSVLSVQSVVNELTTDFTDFTDRSKVEPRVTGREPRSPSVFRGSGQRPGPCLSQGRRAGTRRQLSVPSRKSSTFRARFVPRALLH